MSLTPIGLERYLRSIRSNSLAKVDGRTRMLTIRPGDVITRTGEATSRWYTRDDGVMIRIGESRSRKTRLGNVVILVDGYA